MYRPKPDIRPAPQLRNGWGGWQTPPDRKPKLTGPVTFKCLNEERSVATADAWNDPSAAKLWLYHLHYFDDLNACAAGAREDWHRALIHRWIKENPPGYGNGWEPYPTSLRIVNWIKWHLRGGELDREMLDSLAVQTRWLSKCLEYHLLGNHLIANAKALEFAGTFFDGGEANEWGQKGRCLLERELQEQVLSDGGHFERSPMYHLVILEDVLDLINLCRGFGVDVPGLWRDTAVAMLGWSATMRHPDGEIPFFNDASIGVASQPTQLDAYAKRLSMSTGEANERSKYLSESGYTKIVRGNTTAFLDNAPIGPAYLPAHGHADTLSFELSVNGRRLFVNSGTSTYDPGALRIWQRSTAAHNTVTVNNENSSEVWGVFRVGRRADPRVDSLDLDAPAAEIRASHNGYHDIPGRPVHKRIWKIDDGQFSVRDRIESGKGVNATSYVYFHPDIEAKEKNAFQVDLYDRRENSSIGELRIFGGASIEIESAYWYPEFGVEIPNKRLTITADNTSSPLDFGYTIKWFNSD